VEAWSLPQRKQKHYGQVMVVVIILMMKMLGSLLDMSCRTAKFQSKKVRFASFAGSGVVFDWFVVCGWRVL
jgi:hypothetical protein